MRGAPLRGVDSSSHVVAEATTPLNRFLERSNPRGGVRLWEMGLFPFIADAG